MTSGPSSRAGDCVPALGFCTVSQFKSRGLYFLSSSCVGGCTTGSYFLAFHLLDLWHPTNSQCGLAYGAKIRKLYLSTYQYSLLYVDGLVVATTNGIATISFGPLKFPLEILA